MSSGAEREVGGAGSAGAIHRIMRSGPSAIVGIGDFFDRQRLPAVQRPPARNGDPVEGSIFAFLRDLAEGFGIREKNAQ